MLVLSYDEMLVKLKKALSVHRLEHSLGVERTAVEMAKRYGADTEKARIAGLLHDCARDIPFDVQLKMAENFGILLDEIERSEKALIHGPLGEIIAHKYYGVQDAEILKAIRLHTTGDVNMTVLDKIIFLSDYIEPNRNFPGVDELRKKAFKDLNEAVIAAFDSTINFVIQKKSLLHYRSVNARNYILLHERGEGKI